MKNNNKAQISSQIFVYIMAAVIITIILLIGYKAISAVMKPAMEAPINDFVNDFTNEVKQRAKNYGDRDKFEFTLPKKFTQVCFIDSMNEDDEFEISANIDNVFIQDIVDDNIEKNVFLMNEKFIEESFYVEKLDVLGDYLCIDNQGVMEVWIEGKGRTACLTEEMRETCP